MKKLIALVLALVLCLGLVACGGPDKQPAIDAFNKASKAFNEVSATINADIESFDEEVIKTMTDMANVLNQHQAKLQGDEKLSQEQLDEMIAWYGEVEKWVADVKAELDALNAEPTGDATEPATDDATEPAADDATEPAGEAATGKEAALAAYTTAEAAYQAVAAIMNENIDSIDEQTIILVSELYADLNTYYAQLTSEEEISQEDLDAMIAWFDEVVAWADSFIAESGIE